MNNKKKTFNHNKLSGSNTLYIFICSATNASVNINDFNVLVVINCTHTHTKDTVFFIIKLSKLHYSYLKKKL